ncbi:MAG: energy transducer TonB [Acidobacteriota bacterium]
MKAIILSTVILFLLSITTAVQPATINLALFAEEGHDPLVTALAAAFTREGLTLQDRSLTGAVTRSLQFPNRYNLTRTEARNWGLALGVDFYVALRVQMLERVDVGTRLYTQCYIALFFINARNGELSHFDFVEVRGETLAATQSAAATEIVRRIPEYVRRLREAFEQQFIPRQLDEEDRAAIEVPAEGEKEGFKSPVVLVRRQPDYSETARKMGISAVVEVEAVLRRDGKIGQVEIVRWAGFGLDEATATAVRQLKFKPATLQGREISCRALLRYNFNFKVQ